MTSSLENEKDLLILIWLGRYHGHENGSPGVRFTHCSSDILTPAITTNIGNSTT